MAWNLLLLSCSLVLVTCNPLPGETTQMNSKSPEKIGTRGFDASTSYYHLHTDPLMSPKNDLMTQETFHYWAHPYLWGGWGGLYRPYYYRWHHPYWHTWWW